MVSYDSFLPGQLTREDWLRLQEIQRAAYVGSLLREQTEIDQLVDWNDPDRYVASHVDPNTEVGKRFNEDQEYSTPRLVIAHDGSGSNEGFIGFAYGAYNVSGSSSLIRAIKKHRIDKNYFWVREIAVVPERQREHIGLHMAQTLIKGLDQRTPLAAYSWPDEYIDFDMPELPLFLLGFQVTGEGQAKPFGDENMPTRQVRYQGAAEIVLNGLNLFEENSR